MRPKEKISNWFGSRGIPMKPSWIKRYRIVGTQLYIVTKLPSRIDGVYASSTYDGEFDIYELNSSCAELWDTKPIKEMNRGAK